MLWFLFYIKDCVWDQKMNMRCYDQKYNNLQHGTFISRPPGVVNIKVNNT